MDTIESTLIKTDQINHLYNLYDNDKVLLSDAGKYNNDFVGSQKYLVTKLALALMIQN